MELKSTGRIPIDDTNELEVIQVHVEDSLILTTPGYPLIQALELTSTEQASMY